MGCFLACFGSSKEVKARKQRHRVEPRYQGYPVSEPFQSSFSSAKNEPIVQVSEAREKAGELLSSNTRKKVTFDSNVKTYEHVPTHDEAGHSAEEKESRKEGEEDSGNISRRNSCSDDASVTSSLGSYPPNHRYGNCPDSDGEDEVLDFADSCVDNIDDEDNQDDEEEEFEDLSEDDEAGITELVSGTSKVQIFTEEVESSIIAVGGLPEKETCLNRNVRDRSAYVHSVLNPVENLSQWKAVKAAGKPHKENLILEQGLPISNNSSDPSIKEFSATCKVQTVHPRKPSQEVAVDASLSNWLVSEETTPVNKKSTSSGVFVPEKSSLQGSNSPRSQEDRPILGALTVEELKQFSVSPPQRKSPSRSPDEMPIIGTVGSYWSHKENSGSVSSFKGIPNTTSKYREDKTVNWHATPFETRLERALNRGAGVAHSN